MSERILRKIRDVVGGRLEAAAERALVTEVAELVDEEVRLERARCIEICQARAELWTHTTGAKSSIAAARDEARSRANEATYIADLLTSSSRFHAG